MLAGRDVPEVKVRSQTAGRTWSASSLPPSLSLLSLLAFNKFLFIPLWAKAVAIFAPLWAPPCRPLLIGLAQRVTPCHLARTHP